MREAHRALVELTAYVRELVGRHKREGIDDTLLEDLGVQLFRWREVILTGLLPTLRRKPTDGQIEAAHRFLRIYFDEERGGDQEVAQQIGIVPVRARAHRPRSWVWRPAGKTYFSGAWLDNTDVEDLYQVLGQQEFLAEKCPDDAEARPRERAYFAWLGVADSPRPIRFESQIQPGWTTGRPEGADAGRWRAYVGSLAKELNDPQGHPLSQRLRTYTLDRLDELLTRATPKQGQALLRLMATHWESYAPMFDAELRCTNGQHHGERSRPVRSYAAFVLRATAWVLVRIGNTTRMLPANKVWLTGADVPRRLGQLPVFPLPAPHSLRRPRHRRVYEEQTIDLAR